MSDIPPYNVGMAKSERFEIRMEPEQKRQIEAVASSMDISSAEAARLAIWVGLTVLQGQYTGGGPDFLQVMAKLIASVGSHAIPPDQLALFLEYAEQIKSSTSGEPA